MMLANFISFISNLVSMILGISTPQKFPPPLPAEKEREYFSLMREKSDESARQKLILHNLRLVSHIVRKYYETIEKHGNVCYTYQ